MYTGTTIIDKSEPDCNTVMMKENNHPDEVESVSATKAKKISPAWDVVVHSAPKHQTMSTSFLLCISVGTLTGLSEDTSVSAAVK